MRQFLIRRFIKDYEDVKNPAVRESYGRLAGIVGIVSNVLLCGLKIAAGLLFSSIAILADGINNLADASSSLITLIGFRLASKPADEDHPYGHARIEYITGLIVSLLIIILGLQLLSTSVEKILHPDPLEFSILSVAVLITAIAVKIWQANFNIKMGEAIDSAALKATGQDSRNDVISTSVVLLGILIGKLAGIQLDGILGTLVALFIVYSGFQLIKETSDPLLGQAPEPALVEAIQAHVKAHPGVLGIHDLVIHDYGPGRIFASVHVEVDAHRNLMESHDMIDNIERSVGRELHIQLTIHMDPLDTKDPLTGRVRDELLEITSGMEDILSTHDLRVVSGCTHHNVIFDVVVSRDCRMTDSEIKTRLTEALKARNPKYCTVITVEHNFVGEAALNNVKMQ
ncbi:cation diffusion facilitator family transporter [Bacilliculturomica massiliensis]|uniref:cation diffusion facilitator family transporter n=1 Tax=Bacilliculturomica massiliensis TaxID=1917867 RepID=UPI0010303CB5|nr:cation diffusion facilitator family transporter [Bacilliculturomica massiliensis]